MKYIHLVALFIFFGFVNGYAEEDALTLPLKQTLSEGAEITFPIDNSQIKRIVISVHNLIEDESIFYRSEFIDGAERPDNEIGPKVIRTHALAARITDPDAVVRRDRKTIVLDTSGLDALYLKVEKGTVEIELSEEKKRL